MAGSAAPCFAERRDRRACSHNGLRAELRVLFVKACALPASMRDVRRSQNKRSLRLSACATCPVAKHGRERVARPQVARDAHGAGDVHACARADGEAIVRVNADDRLRADYAL
eukprot:976104-Prymnesium_polylepis.2